jgi:hypothetical protein
MLHLCSCTCYTRATHMLHPCSCTCYTPCHAHATPVPCTCYTRATHMLHPCHAHATPVLLHLLHPVPCTCHTFRPPPYIWVSYLRRTRHRAPYRRVSRLTLDPSRFRSGVSGQKPLRRVSAQILTFTHPWSQNVYERVDYFLSESEARA